MGDQIHVTLYTCRHQSVLGFFRCRRDNLGEEIYCLVMYADKKSISSFWTIRCVESAGCRGCAYFSFAMTSVLD